MIEVQVGAGAELEVVRTNVFDIDASYDGCYDVVYVTVGGALFIYEMHPLFDMLDPDSGLTLKHSYFRTEPYPSAGESDYFDKTQIVYEPSYWHHHRMADIIGGCLKHGLALEHFEEHTHDVSNVFAHLASERMLPLSYTLVARRP